MTNNAMIPPMPESAARMTVSNALHRFWSEGGLPHEALLSLDACAATAVDALKAAGAEDDLNLAEGPLDVIASCLSGRYMTDDSGREDLAVDIYEALMSAGCLPGINAQLTTPPDFG